MWFGVPLWCEINSSLWMAKVCDFQNEVVDDPEA